MQFINSGGAGMNDIYIEDFISEIRLLLEIKRKCSCAFDMADPKEEDKYHHLEMIIDDRIEMELNELKNELEKTKSKD